MGKAMFENVEAAMSDDIASPTVAAEPQLIGPPVPGPPFIVEFMDPAIAEILRTKTVAEKIAMVSAAHQTAKKLVASGIRGMHPDWSEAEVHSEMVRRMLHGAN